MPNVIEMGGALRPRDSWTADRCPIASALDVVRTRSSFLVLREAFYGATRFDDFSERSGLSEPVTAARLSELAEAGILQRVPYRDPGQRTRQGYALTEKGAELLPVLVALMQWGDRWEQDGRAPVQLRHRGCGGRVEAQLRCDHDHSVPADELELVRAPRPSRA
jgi:DNA-binding HxlR family transcriptional regulator